MGSQCSPFLCRLFFLYFFSLDLYSNILCRFCFAFDWNECPMAFLLSIFLYFNVYRPFCSYLVNHCDVFLRGVCREFYCIDTFSFILAPFVFLQLRRNETTVLVLLCCISYSRYSLKSQLQMLHIKNTSTERTC